jgi:Family of unknown function (DUF5681)
MIRRLRRITRAPNRDSRSAAGTDYSVGYGKPPRKHWFQPGQSGNPRGRPKGAKNTATLLREILDRKIEVRTGGTPRKITVREAILTRFAESSLKGDTKAAAFLMQRYDMPEGAQEHASDTTPEEQEILDAYAETYLKKARATRE